MFHRRRDTHRLPAGKGARSPDERREENGEAETPRCDRKSRRRMVLFLMGLRGFLLCVY